MVSYAHVPGVKDSNGSGRGYFGLGDDVDGDASEDMLSELTVLVLMLELMENAKDEEVVVSKDAVNASSDRRIFRSFIALFGSL